MLSKSHSIIIALISFGCGLLVPHLMIDSTGSITGSTPAQSFIMLLLSQWKDSLIDLPIWIHEELIPSITWKTKTFTSHSTLPLYMYQNKSQYHDALRKKEGNRTEKHHDSTSSITTSQQYPCTTERRLDFLHNTTIYGYHVLCFSTSPTNLDTKEYTLTIYRFGIIEENNSNNDNRYAYTTTIVPHEMSWSQFQSDIISDQILSLRSPRKNKQPYALYTIDGQRIVDEESVESNDNDTNNHNHNNTITPWFVEVMAQEMGMVLLYEGGQFVWPGIRIGYERHVSLYSIMPIHSPNMDHQPPINVTLVTLSISPLVLSVHGFLSEEECQHIQRRALPTMAYSDVVLMDQDAGRPASDFRTSQTSFLDADHDNILTDIDYRTASLIRIPRNHQEPVQVLRYGVSEKYSAHHDYFNPKSYKNDKGTLRLIQNGKRNRFVTVFWYLSTVPEGGETIFPRAYGQYEHSSDDCDTGLKVRPELGKVILFYNMKMDGTTDPQSLHGACPVREGIKWAANKWVWNAPMSYVSL